MSTPPPQHPELRSNLLGEAIVFQDGREAIVVSCWEDFLGIYPLEFAGKVPSRKVLLKEASHRRCSSRKHAQRGCRASCWLPGAPGLHALQELDRGEASHTAGARPGSTAEVGSKPLSLLESVSSTVYRISASWPRENSSESTFISTGQSQSLYLSRETVGWYMAQALNPNQTMCRILSIWWKGWHWVQGLES